MASVENLPARAVSTYSSSSMTDKTTRSGASDPLPSAIDSNEDKVKLSVTNGRALLMVRVFHSTADADPPVEEIDTASGVTANYLRLDDREKLAKLYDFASNNGIDLAHVDALSFDLAIYRRSLEKSTSGAIYDLEGHRVTCAFSERETKEADHIRASEALKNTYFDHSFIQEILNPVEMPSHATDFKFLEKALEVLSPSGDEGKVSAQSGPDGFQVSKKWAPGDEVIENKSEDIQFDYETQSLVGQASGESRQELIKRLVKEFLHNNSQSISTYDALMHKHPSSDQGSWGRSSSREVLEAPLFGASVKLSLSADSHVYSMISIK